MKTLDELFPGKDLETIKNQAADLNRQRSFEMISAEEHQILLESLLNSAKIVSAANKLERQKLFDQALSILRHIPIKV